SVTREPGRSFSLSIKSNLCLTERYSAEGAASSGSSAASATMRFMILLYWLDRGGHELPHYAEISVIYSARVGRPRPDGDRDGNRPRHRSGGSGHAWRDGPRQRDLYRNRAERPDERRWVL